MNKKTSVKSNFGYQTIYNLVTMVIPLVVTPFLTRALLETEIGNFTYSRSIASYFVIFAMLGIVKYGQRVISQSRNDEIKLRKSFWSLFYIHFILSAIGILSYLLMTSIIVQDSKDLFWIQTLYVASAMFDITWLYYGLENFKSVVVRNSVIKIIEAALYIFLIKSPADIYLYAIINCGAFLVSQLALIPGIIKEIKPIHVEWKECIAHVKPLFVLGVAVIGISLYTIFDTTLLGFFSTKDNVAFYEYSNRIARIPLTGASIIGTVLFPRACKYVAQNNFIEQKKYMNYSVIIVSIIGSAAFWGLLAIGEPMAEIYLGENFKNCGPIISFLSPLVYIVGIGDVLRMQYMIPNGMDKEYIKSIFLSAIINVVISTILILSLPVDLQVYGAVIGTIAAESVGMIYQICLCKKVLSIRYLIKTISLTLLIGMIMYGVLRLFTNVSQWNVGSLLMSIMIGAVVFIPLTIAYICLFEKDFKKAVFKK